MKWPGHIATKQKTPHKQTLKLSAHEIPYLFMQMVFSSRMYRLTNRFPPVTQLSSHPSASRKVLEQCHSKWDPRKAAPAADELMAACEKWKFLGPISYLLNQNLWEWGPAVCFCSSPPIMLMCAEAWETLLQNTSMGNYEPGASWRGRWSVLSKKHAKDCTAVLQSSEAAHPFNETSSMYCRVHTCSRRGGECTQ